MLFHQLQRSLILVECIPIKDLFDLDWVVLAGPLGTSAFKVFGDATVWGLRLADIELPMFELEDIYILTIV